MTTRPLLTVKIYVIIVLTLLPTHVDTQTHTEIMEENIHTGLHMTGSGCLLFLTDIYGVKQR